jgi:hypothetical protein
MDPDKRGVWEDREQAGERYEQIRRTLVIFFRCDGCPSADEAVDETIDRVFGTWETSKWAISRRSVGLARGVAAGVDFNITQAADGTKGGHAMIPKASLTGFVRGNRVRQRTSSTDSGHRRRERRPCRSIGVISHKLLLVQGLH